MLSSIPVALPSMSTLAAAVGAGALGWHGVLPTCLCAVDEAGGINVLCADKTGTLTRNELAVVFVAAMPGQGCAHILALAALASSDGGQDPVDTAIRAAAAKAAAPEGATLVSLVQPSRPRASIRFADGTAGRFLKGAFAVIAPLCHVPVEAEAATGAAASSTLVSLIALSDPPRADGAGNVRSLAGLGVRMKMLTGDAASTASVVAARSA